MFCYFLTQYRSFYLVLRKLQKHLRGSSLSWFHSCLSYSLQHCRSALILIQNCVNLCKSLWMSGWIIQPSGKLKKWERHWEELERRKMKKFDWRRKPVKLAIFICCMIILSLLLNPSDTHRCLCSQWTTVFAQGQAEEEANMSQTTVPPSGGCQLCVSPDSTPSDLSQA